MYKEIPVIARKGFTKSFGVGGSRLQGMDVPQVAVRPSVVDPVSHDEHVGHLKPHILHVQVDLPPRGLGEKSKHLQGRGLAAEQEASQVRERKPTVYNVVHD